MTENINQSPHPATLSLTQRSSLHKTKNMYQRRKITQKNFFFLFPRNFFFNSEERISISECWKGHIHSCSFHQRAIHHESLPRTIRLPNSVLQRRSLVNSSLKGHQWPLLLCSKVEVAVWNNAAQSLTRRRGSCGTRQDVKKARVCRGSSISRCMP